MDGDAVFPPDALSVCIVENHADSRDILTLLLEQMGHTVTSAEDLSGAIALLRCASFDLLISDIGLPDGSGWELLEAVGDARPPCCVAMSGYGTNSDRERSRLAGYRHHLVKPMDSLLLEHVLAEASQLRHQRAAQG